MRGAREAYGQVVMCSGWAGAPSTAATVINHVRAVNLFATGCCHCCHPWVRSMSLPLGRWAGLVPADNPLEEAGKVLQPRWAWKGLQHLLPLSAVLLGDHQLSSPLEATWNTEAAQLIGDTTNSQPCW